MPKIHNFSAGPSILAPVAFEKSIEAIRNFAGTGLSSLMSVPDDYDILFLQGGASTQFFQIPHNFLRTSASYLKTGVWAAGAIKEAKLYGEVNVVASSESDNYSFIPKNYSIPSSADYFHCTSNNTIYGTQMQEFPDSPVPMFCDMSSDIFSRPVNTASFDLIY
ncbi:MAG: aminotransferase class V-fold PLP-dependent enzyme, partial [Bacteroidetes bacterium]|nr:aminotransferase class V-fold PLP-dependent enzyme [Bacteroidota bacterium]